MTPGVEGLEGGLEDAPNPSYRPDPCRWRRYDVLLGLNPWEAEACCRVVLSMLMGSIIGFERQCCQKVLALSSPELHPRARVRGPRD